mmetsp:Transcript_41697/g.91537  ORF Transcript_41697/g.91537 Transcript_41697/m.91537 type:complete len:332 (-) Transcript_41697:444-1439(-)
MCMQSTKHACSMSSAHATRDLYAISVRSPSEGAAQTPRLNSGPSMASASLAALSPRGPSAMRRRTRSPCASCNLARQLCRHRLPLRSTCFSLVVAGDRCSLPLSTVTTHVQQRPLPPQSPVPAGLLSYLLAVMSFGASPRLISPILKFSPLYARNSFSSPSAVTTVTSAVARSTTRLSVSVSVVASAVMLCSTRTSSSYPTASVLTVVRPLETATIESPGRMLDSPFAAAAAADAAATPPGTRARTSTRAPERRSPEIVSPSPVTSSSAMPRPDSIPLSCTHSETASSSLRAASSDDLVVSLPLLGSRTRRVTRAQSAAPRSTSSLSLLSI